MNIAKIQHGKSKYEVADILRRNWQYVETSSLPRNLGGKFTAHQQRMLRALTLCRTADLGGHIDACTSCGVVRISYNSCRNRHCPKCQSTNREQWLVAREIDLLPVLYFHVVFTLPSVLNDWVIREPKLIYQTLFRAAWQTVKVFSKDEKHLGAKSGIISILHSWGQNLSLHPHIHCIIPGGGLTNLGIWKNAKNDGKYLFPVKAMSKVFRAKFVAMLGQAIEKQEINLPNEFQKFKQIFAKNWVVYAKRPFASPKNVLEYLGRYSHKIAISNHRILSIEDGKVNFGYKDYRVGGEKKVMQLSETEFIRRFALHVLPSGFMRIRHYGILSSGHKKQPAPNTRGYLAAARRSLVAQGKTLPTPPKIGQTWEEIAKTRLNFDVKKCSPRIRGRLSCGEQTMVKVGIIPAQTFQKWVVKKERAPPLSSLPRVDLDKIQF